MSDNISQQQGDNDPNTDSENKSGINLAFDPLWNGCLAKGNSNVFDLNMATVGESPQGYKTQVVSFSC